MSVPLLARPPHRLGCHPLSLEEWIRGSSVLSTQDFVGQETRERGEVEEEERRSKGRIVVTVLCPWISAMRCPSRGLLEFALAR